LAKHLPLQGECPANRRGEGVEPHLLRVSKQLPFECPQGKGVDPHLLRVSKQLPFECPQGEGVDHTKRSRFLLFRI